MNQVFANCFVNCSRADYAYHRAKLLKQCSGWWPNSEAIPFCSLVPISLTPQYFIVIFFLGSCSPIHSGMAAAIFSLHWKGSIKKVLLCCAWKQFVILGFLYEPKSTGTSLPSTPLFSYLIGALNPQTVCVLSKWGLRDAIPLGTMWTRNVLKPEAL